MLNITVDNMFLSEHRFFLNNIKKADAINEKFVVIVPEQFSAETEKDLLHLLDVDGLIHVEVLSFKRLVHRIITKDGLGTIEPLTDLGKKMMIAEIVSMHSNELKLFKHTDKVKGLLDKLTEVITDFRHQMLSQKDLDAIAKLTGTSSLLGVKISELSLIYNAYVNRLTADLIDNDALIHMAIQRIQTGAVYADTTFIIEGFSSMTINEINLLMALTQVCKNSYIRLIGAQDNHPVHKYLISFIDILTAKLNENGLDYTISNQVQQISPAMQAFRALFDFKFTGDLSLITLPNIDDEIAYVFTDMIKKNSDEGIAWRDMVIVTGDLTRYYAKLKRMGNRYRIPLFTDSRRPAATHYAVDFVLSLIKAIQTNYRGRDLIKVLKSPLLKVDFDAICHAENYVLSHNINGKAFIKPWRDNDLHTKLLPVIESIFLLGDELKRVKSAKEKIVALKNYLDSYEILETISDDVDSYYDAGNYDFVEELAQIYNIIDHVLYQIFLLGENRNLTIKEFYDLLSLGFDSYEIGVIPNAKDYVVCGNIKRTRIGSVKYIYMIGMTEDSIPSASKTGELFNDDECAFLSAHGINRITTYDDDYDEEVYKTYDFIARASRGVIWTRPLASLDGSNLKPSIWYSQLSEYFIEKNVQVNLDDLKSYNIAVPFITQSISAIKRGDVLSDTIVGALSALKYQERTAPMLSAYFKGAAYGLLPLSLSPALASDLYHTSLSSSISRLESFVKCPYQHFVSYGLQPLVLNDASLTSMDVGNFYHHIIEYVMNQLKHTPNELMTVSALRKHLAVAYQDYVATNYRFMMNYKNMYYSKRLKNVLELSLLQVIEQIKLGKFKNIKNELEFSDRNYADYPALKLVGGLNIRGKIDRIDTAITENGTNYVRLIDYKSSHQGLSVHDVYHGLKLQLMIYLDVARGFTGSAPYGAFYFAVDEPIIEDAQGVDIAAEILDNYKLKGVFIDDVSVHSSVDTSFKEKGKSDITGIKTKKSGDLYSNSSVFSRDDLDVMHRYAKYKASVIAGQIFSGEMNIAPYTDNKISACAYCKYRTICQFDAKKSTFSYRTEITLEDDEAYLEKMREKVKGD